MSYEKESDKLTERHNREYEEQQMRFLRDRLALVRKYNKRPRDHFNNAGLDALGIPYK